MARSREWYDFLSRRARLNLVLTTIDNREDAEELARAIVRNRLAACVNIVDHARSIYWWEDEIQEADEMILLIKTRKELVEDLEAFIREHHPYDLPEFVVMGPESVATDYLNWIRASTSG